MESEYKNSYLSLVSAKGLTKAGKANVYAVASISKSGTFDKVQKFKTPVHKDGGLWNFPMRFTVSEVAGLDQTLVVKIKSTRMFVDKNLGEIHVPLKELMEGIKTEGKTMRVSYWVRGRSAEPKGVVTFFYKFGEIFFGTGGRFGFKYPSGKEAMRVT